MHFYKALRKDPRLSLEDKVREISQRLDSLTVQWDAAFNARRPTWQELLSWIERVEFEIEPSERNMYSLAKRRWRYESTLPHVPTPGRLLDLGSGLGTDQIVLHLATGVRTSGIDMDRLSLETAGVRLKWYAGRLGIGPDVFDEPRHMNAANLGFENATFDYAWSNESIEHIHPTDALFREIARVLRPGGRVMIINQNGLSLYEQAKAIKTRGTRVYWKDTDPLSGKEILIAEERLLTPSRCRRMLEALGFGQTVIVLNGLIPSPLAGRAASADRLNQVDRIMCSVPLLRTQASDFVLVARKES